MDSDLITCLVKSKTGPELMENRIKNRKKDLNLLITGKPNKKSVLLQLVFTKYLLW